MGFRLCRLYAFLTLIVVASHAASPLPPQLYWNSVLPKTPMPTSISELVQPDFLSVGKGGFSFQQGKNFVLDEQDADNAAEIRLIDYNWAWCRKTMFGNNQDAAADKQNPNTVNQIPEDSTRRIYFLEKDIHTGTTLKYRLAAANSSRESFLSRKTAELIPFSSSKLPEILDQFSVKLGSDEAVMIQETIHICEYPAMSGEAKYCATSLESMLDFIASKLGRNVEAISTEVEKEATELQNYTIALGVKKLLGNRLISCHKMVYKYAVYYCHETMNTRAYMVPLEGADGTKAKAVAVCHEDTSKWSPKHYAMRELNIKPGSVPVCHFVKNDNVVWFQNPRT